MDTSDPSGDSRELDAMLNFAVRAEDKTQLRVEAAQEGISMSELARRRLFEGEEVAA